MKTFKVGDFEVGGPNLTVIAGPCMAESPEMCMQVAEHMKGLSEKLGFNYIFKASFDKANRTSISAKRGDGIEAGMEILQAVKTKFGLPVTTDIHLPEHAAIAAQTVDILQIPAFLCRQTDLLAAAAVTGLPVNVKKGQFLSAPSAKNIVSKLEQLQAAGIMLTERGMTFGYDALIVDFPGLEVMRNFGVPVCFDATHSAQRPGNGAETTGGARETIPAMVRAACAVGIDALFIEVHPDPPSALSDSATQWYLEQAEELLATALRVREAVQ